MSWKQLSKGAVAALLLGALAAVAPQRASAQQVGYTPSTAKGDWTHYTADVRGDKYMPLDQIDGSNFNNLEMAWSFSTRNLGPNPEFKLEGTPLAIDGILYAVGGGGRRSVVAIDGATGELLWKYAMDEGERARLSPRQLSGRGVSYWTDGKGDDRIIYVTIGYRLVELNAHTGRPIESFGENGVVDLKKGVMIGNTQNCEQNQVDLSGEGPGEIGLHSTPTVTGDIVIVGSSMAEGLNYRSKVNVKGLVRAYDVRTGKQIWRFNTMPGPGEFGHDTWKGNSWCYTGNTGVWTGITVDEDAGIAYLPVETPTVDLYGGNRPGDGLFGESLVAVDLHTGKRKWHFQMIHHGLWDQDASSPAMLVDIDVDGKPIKAVAMPSKQSFLYMFDRITGKPVWPMPETKVPQSDVPGEHTSPTQPIPSRPAPYARAWVKPSDIIDFTPALHAQALANLKHYRWEQSPYVPAEIPDPNKYLGSINIGNANGGTNWPGGSLDPVTKVAYLQANNSSVSGVAIEAVPPERGDAGYTGGGGVSGAPMSGPYALDKVNKEHPVPRGQGRGGMGIGSRELTQGLQGLPILKPPYGVLTAVDLNTGDQLWQVPHGETPDYIRNNPALKGMDIPRTGQGSSVGLLVTKTLVVLGDPQVTAPPGRERGAMLRAYDKKTGKNVGSVWMPAGQSGSPMTYMAHGKQYIVVAVGGRGQPAEYLSFALPNSALKGSETR